MTIDDDAMIQALAALGHDSANPADDTARLARFRSSLQRMRDDDTEAARIADLVEVTEQDDPGSLIWQVAEARLRASWDRHLRTFGPHHPITLTAVVAHAAVLVAVGRAVEAQGILTTNLPHLRQRFGSRGRQSLRARFLLGQALAQQGDYQSAVHCFQEAYDGQVELLGEAHAETLTVALELGVARKMTGSSHEAQCLFQLVVRRAPETVGERSDLYCRALFASGLSRLPEWIWRKLGPRRAEVDRGLLAVIDQLDQLDETVTAAELEDTVVRIVELTAV